MEDGRDQARIDRRCSRDRKQNRVSMGYWNRSVETGGRDMEVVVK